MDDLKRIEGKTITSAEKQSDGKNSYLILKFEGGGKANISAYPNDKGVGQLELSNENENDMVGQRIHSVAEEFDGASDFIRFTFKDNSKLDVTAFNTLQDATASLEITVYASDKLVAESVNEYVDYTKPDQWHFPQNESGEEEIEEMFGDEDPKPKKIPKRKKWSRDDKDTRQKSFSGGYEKDSWRGANPNNK